MKVRIDGHDAVEKRIEKLSDDFLTYRLARCEGVILSHVTHIGRHQHNALCARVPQSLRCEK